MRHTPGPWTHSEQRWGKTNCLVAQVWDSQGRSLATIEPTESPNEASANASLMAAAPDLRDSVLALLDIVESEYENDPEREDLPSWKRDIDNARAALKKAGVT